MDWKRGSINFILIFAFVILSISFISSTICDVRLASSCPAVNTVMKLSSQTNAHGEIYNGVGNYQYALCCFGMSYYTAADNASMHTCNGTANTILKLSSSTNAHGQTPNEVGYTTSVCFGKFTCTSTTAASCPSNYVIPMVSLSASTNAHLAQLSGYNTKICCNDTLTAVCGNRIREAGEACDDGDVSSGDGCSATCNIESGCVCPVNPLGGQSCCFCSASITSNWLLNGAPFSGGNITLNDILTMRFNDDFCKASGAGTTFTIYEGASSRATAPSTVVAGDPGTTTSTYTLPLTFLQALGPGTSSILFRTTVDGTTYTSSTINVNSIYCGNGVCDRTSGESCSNCIADCGCNDGNLCTTDSCSAGSCVYTPVNCNDNNACTLDVCNLGACTHFNIVGCCNLNNQCNDNNICTGPDTCNLATHTCSNPALSCGVNNDGCCPTGCDIGSDNDCTICGDDGDCEDSDICTTDTCSGGSCTFPSVGCNNLVSDGCCLSGCNALNDRDCSAVCGNGIRENPPEECDGAALGGATCLSEMGAGYSGSLSCYAAGTPNECQYNTAACIPPCDLTDAFWNYTTPEGSSISEGTLVLLNITGTNCAGKTIRFDIREKDMTGTQDVTPDPASITFPASGTSAAASWISVFQDDGLIEGNPPEYYFTASVDGSSPAESEQSPHSNVHDSGLLRVSQVVVPPSCPDTDCGAGEDCNNCPEDCGECPPICTLTSAAWSVASTIEGNQVLLNVGASNCDGEEITFEIKEDDSGLDGDDSVTTPATNIPSYSASNNHGTWTAEWQDDDGGALSSEENPPEYYFIARVTGLPGVERQSGLLEVNTALTCVGFDYCYQLPFALCGVCDVGDASQEGCGLTPGDPCDTLKECGCAWNSGSGACEPTSVITEICDDGTETKIGECKLTWTGDDSCSEGITSIERTITGDMIWDVTNDYDLSEVWGTVGVDFREDPPGSGHYRYDPNDLFTECETTTIQTIRCPALVELPGFGIYQAIIVIILLALIYLVYLIRKNNKLNSMKAKKSKNTNKRKRK